eukprot:1504547-Alexandrium_andersonii.AAC.1
MVPWRAAGRSGATTVLRHWRPSGSRSMANLMRHSLLEDSLEPPPLAGGLRPFQGPGARLRLRGGRARHAGSGKPRWGGRGTRQGARGRTNGR